MNITKSIILASALSGLLLASCSSDKKWEVNGTTGNQFEGKTVYLSQLNGSEWQTIDSATVASNAFSFKGSRFDSPQILRLTLGDDAIFLPIDSIDVITVDAGGSSFGSESRISGSHSADMMQQINDIVNKAVATDPSALDSEQLKREVSSVMSQNLGGIASYYAVNKTVGNRPLFDATKSFDKRIIGGVATQFSTQHPDDPRSKQLEQLVLSNNRIFGSNPRVIEAEEIPFVDISLRDAKGQIRTLSDIWSSGKTIVLNFTALTAAEAPALNVALNDVYKKYSDRGLEIFQVCVDPDEFAWEAASKALPWVSVYCNPNTGAPTLLNYNVVGIPTTYVISRDGNRMERVDDLTKLDSTVSSML